MGAYRGFKAREEIRDHHDSLDIPDPPEHPKSTVKATKKQPQKKHRAAWADVVEAAMTIQRAYRMHRKRKILKEIGVDDIENAEKAIVRIQSQFKGFQTRKSLQTQTTVLEKHTAKIVEKPTPCTPKKITKTDSKAKKLVPRDQKQK